MRTIFAKKIWVTLLAVLAVAALMGLAAGLKNVSFRPAQPFSRNETVTLDPASLRLADNVTTASLSTQIFFWVLAGLLCVCIGILISAELRKQLFKALLRAAAVYWAIYILFTRYHDVMAQIGLSFTQRGGVPAAASQGAQPVPEFKPPQTVSWMTYLVSFGIAVLLVILAWRLNAAWKQLNKSTADSSIKKLGSIARSSLRDLSNGRDSTDVIMNCYYRMGDVVSDKKMIDRHLSMTPSEFAIRLEQAGLPIDAVRQLTRLFETVRYGGRRLNSAAVNEAVACLTTILNHCGEAV
jgi:hypothetical protein